MSTRQQSIIEALHSALIAQQNCKKSGNAEWDIRWTAYIERIRREHLPSGGGFDAGTRVIGLAADGHGVKLETDFHHMDDNGSYDGWTHHTIVVRPTFVPSSVHLTITGPDRNSIKDYISDMYSDTLTRLLPEGFAP